MDYTIDTLRAFCSNSTDPREWMRRPFVFNGLTIACSGYVMAFLDGARPGVECAAPPQNAANGLLRLIERSRSANSSAGVRAADIPLPPAEPCRFCHGSKEKPFEPTTSCDDCDGAGYFDHGHHSYDCMHCDGDGVVTTDPAEKGMPCPSCDGSGEALTVAAVDVSNAQFLDLGIERRILAALHEHFPNARVFPDDSGGSRIFLLQFAGGGGAVMPIYGRNMRAAA